MITHIRMVNGKPIFEGRSFQGENTRENLATVRANLGARTFAHRQLQRAKIEAKNTALCDRAILQRESRRARRQK